MKWYLRGCPSCGGDLREDADDRAWATCMMCARSFKVREIFAARSSASARLETLPGRSDATNMDPLSLLEKAG